MYLLPRISGLHIEICAINFLSDDTPITPGSSENRRFVEYMDHDDEKEKYENTKFRKVEIAGKDYRVDMKVIEPYKKVLSHGGKEGFSLMIVSLCGLHAA